MSDVSQEIVSDDSPNEQQDPPRREASEKRVSKSALVKFAVAGVSVLALALLAVGGFSLSAERDQLKVELEMAAGELDKATGELDKATDSLTSMTRLRDTAVDQRDACSARAELYRQGSILYSDEMQKYLANPYYSIQITESLEYIKAGNSMPCPS